MTALAPRPEWTDAEYIEWRLTQFVIAVKRLARESAPQTPEAAEHRAA